ncbi:MAG: hypothetical protein JXR64_12625 [Spirochaetales bacterium]|nr:hypothetical protein [Spirochaetales bacterium]
MKHKIIFIFFLFSSFLYSEDKREFQIKSNNPNSSFLAVNLGSFSGLSLISDRMQLSIGYSFFQTDGYSISTDLFLYQLTNKSFSFQAGLGGGIIFKPSIGDFESFALLRLPLKVVYSNFYLEGIGMFGATMYEKKISWYPNVSISVGYQFDLYREDKKRLPEEPLN